MHAALPELYSLPLVKTALEHESLRFDNAKSSSPTMESALPNILQAVGFHAVQFALHEFFILRQGKGASAASNEARCGTQVAMSIGETLGVLSQSKFGKTVTNAQTHTLLSTMSLRLIGAIVIAHSYETCRQLVLDQLTTSSSRTRKIDFKTVLQEYLQGKKLETAKYDLVNTVGPDHNKTFIVSVTVGSRRSQGEGRSKKQAEMGAAKSYLETYVPALLRSYDGKTFTDSEDITYDRGVIAPTLRPAREAISPARRLCRLLAIPNLDPSLVAISLTVDGHLNGSRNQAFGVLGATLEHFACAVHIYASYGSQLPYGAKIQDLIQTIVSTKAQLALYHALSLEQFAIAKAREHAGPNMKTAVVKALLVPVYLAKGSFADFLGFLQKELGSHVDRLLSEFGGSPMRSDAKGTLQSFCQIFPDVLPRYENSGSGPDHQRVFKSSVYLDLATPAMRALGTGVGTSLSEAEKKAAQQALATLIPGESVDGELFVIRRAFWRALLRRVVDVQSSRIPWGLGVEGFRSLNAVTAFSSIEAFSSQLPGLIKEVGIETLAPAIARSAGPISPFPANLIKQNVIKGIDMLVSIKPEDVGLFLSDEVTTWLKKLRAIASKIKFPAELLYDSASELPLVALEATHFSNISIHILSKEAAAPEHVFSHLVDILESIEEESQDHQMAIRVSELRNNEKRGLLLHCDGKSARRALEHVRESMIGGAFFNSCYDEVKTTDSLTIYVIGTVTKEPSNESMQLFTRVMRILLDSQKWVGVLHRALHDLKNQVLTLRNQAQQCMERGVSSYQLLANIEKTQGDLLVRKAALTAFFDAGLITERTFCDPRSTIRNVALSQLSTLPSSINFSFSEDIRATKMFIDEHLLTSILINLVKNAADAMPNGGNLTLRASSDDSALYIEVKDSGYGIDPSRIPHLFSTMRSTKGGMGLGLATVKRIVDTFEGIIDVASALNAGSTFSIVLPLGAE